MGKSNFLSASTDAHPSDEKGNLIGLKSFPSPHLVLAEEPRIEYLKKTTFEYIFSAAVVAYVTFGVVFYELAKLSNQHHELLKSNLNPPWIPFRWLGSHGVDVTDGQWYYIISFLPFALPVMGIFAFLSRRQRRGRLLVLNTHEASSAVSNGSHAKGSFRLETNSPPAELKNSSMITPWMNGNEGGGKSPSCRQSGLAEVVDGSLLDSSDTHYSKSTSEVVYARRDLRNTHILHFLFGLFIALGVTGLDSLFGLAFIIANYYGIRLLYKYSSFRLSMVVMWTTHVAILFLHYFVGQYRLGWFGLGFLDDLWRPLFRWTMLYNMSMLRMISFNMDLHEAMDVEGSAAKHEQIIQKHESSCIECTVIRGKSRYHPQGPLTEEIQCLRCRTDCPRLPSEYHLLSYLAYVFYPPLYLTGPMLAFNAYTSYLHHATRGMVGRAVWRYALRCAGSGALLSFVMHYAHIGALLDRYQQGLFSTPGETAGARIPFSQSQRLILFYALLGFLWLKLDFVWKLARLIALCDGVEPPEDMRRCFCNTVSIQGFWRDWHASFNMWIVRYMYIPMGGTKNKIFAIFVIFFFIAIWHDIDVRLLCWAGLACIFFVPEILISSFFTSSKNKFIQRQRRRPLVWRWVRIIGAQFGILELILINLTGFMLGTAAPTSEVLDFFRKTSWRCIIFIFFFTLCGANVAVQDRDQQAHEERVLRIKHHLKMK